MHISTVDDCTMLHMRTLTFISCTGCYSSLLYLGLGGFDTYIKAYSFR